MAAAATTAVAAEGEEQMAAPIFAVDLSVSPDRKMFGIADSAVGSDVSTPVPSSAGGWLGIGDSEVLVGTGQDIVEVAVRMESWAAEPPDDLDPAESSGSARLRMPSGRISVNEITGGWQSDVLELPEPGTYRVRVDAYGRARTEQAVAELFARFEDVSDPAFEAACEELEGRERYVIRIWPDRGA
ncbi:hypothetical protein [Actinoallomurus sp. NPDC052274]|uniref:hypothetical protein n=1 Tax=Actinoallomurus sp. NPDC052274 TaxID=3155420 RepID=UPI003441722D